MREEKGRKRKGEKGSKPNRRGEVTGTIEEVRGDKRAGAERGAEWKQNRKGNIGGH